MRSSVERRYAAALSWARKRLPFGPGLKYPVQVAWDHRHIRPGDQQTNPGPELSDPPGRAAGSLRKQKKNVARVCD